MQMNRLLGCATFTCVFGQRVPTAALARSDEGGETIPVFHSNRGSRGGAATRSERESNRVSASESDDVLGPEHRRREYSARWCLRDVPAAIFLPSGLENFSWAHAVRLPTTPRLRGPARDLAWTWTGGRHLWPLIVSAVPVRPHHRFLQFCHRNHRLTLLGPYPLQCDHARDGGRNYSTPGTG